MKREDILRIFEGATKEQIDQILDINSGDVGRALNRQKDELEHATEELREAKETIAKLEQSSADADELKRQIDAYREADERRAQEAREAAERAELEERFGAVSGERKFVHDMVREGVMRDFGAALKDKANRGKSDREIFDALTKDKDYFASQNPQANPFRPMGDAGPVKVENREAFFKLSFADQMRFKEQNAEQFRQLFSNAPKF